MLCILLKFWSQSVDIAWLIHDKTYDRNFFCSCFSLFLSVLFWKQDTTETTFKEQISLNFKLAQIIQGWDVSNIAVHLLLECPVSSNFGKTKLSEAFKTKTVLSSRKKQGLPIVERSQSTEWSRIKSLPYIRSGMRKREGVLSSPLSNGLSDEATI